MPARMQHHLATGRIMRGTEMILRSAGVAAELAVGDPVQDIGAVSLDFEAAGFRPARNRDIPIVGGNDRVG
jgi:hypothetical protein